MLLHYYCVCFLQTWRRSLCQFPGIRMGEQSTYTRPENNYNNETIIAFNKRGEPLINFLVDVMAARLLELFVKKEEDVLAGGGL